MKVWTGYGSEHSANLVMIGHFREVRDAERAKEVIDKITEQAGKEGFHDSLYTQPSECRYSADMMTVLSSVGLLSIGPRELEQFLYHFSADVDGSTLVIRTDESEISAFLKILIDKGAKVEVYSAHEHPAKGEDPTDATRDEK